MNLQNTSHFSKHLNLASWNVNSFKVREPNVIEWLQKNKETIATDILCLQELKMLEPNWEQLQNLGWEHIACHAQKTYNGVAIISKIPFFKTDVDFNIDDNTDLTTQFNHALTENGLSLFVGQARVVAVCFTVNDTNFRLINVYVPNGESLESEKFKFKLLWLHYFEQYIQAIKKNQAANKNLMEQLLICGDFNIAPLPQDVSSNWKSQLLRSPQELEAFQKLLNCGLIDVLGENIEENATEEPIFTWWDYRMKSFERNLGLRIDHWLIDHDAYENIHQIFVDKTPRAKEKPSDHIPVCLSLRV